MMRKTMAVALVVACFSAYADDQANSGHKMTKGGSGDAATIARIMRAGPSSISKDATITKVSNGKMVELRKGTNGWVCMAMSELPDATTMCLDKEWQSWTEAYVNDKDPKVKGIGTSYMLLGDRGASNTDPSADKPTATNDWVVSGPHIMILTPDPAQLDALPTDPWNGGPWVMWKGTKYAHIMVPIAPMPKPAAKSAEKK